LSIYEDIKKAIQEALAPDVSEIKGEVKALNTRLDSIEKVMNVRFDSLDQRFDDLLARLELTKRIEKLEREQLERKAS
jgi:transcriptional regulator NrdR family protein